MSLSFPPVKLLFPVLSKLLYVIQPLLMVPPEDALHVVQRLKQWSQALPCVQSPNTWNNGCFARSLQRS